MKVKRFKNLWAMGLILFGAILIAFYVAKIFFPEFIVGVAEIPAIVNFGKYVDTHKWAGLLYHFVISYIGGYLYYAACYRKYKLNIKENLFVIIFVILNIATQYLLPKIYTPFLYSAMILQPLIVLYLENKITKNTFISVCACFVIDIMAQALSLQIRDIIMLTSQLNTATMTILLIDAYIWKALLYLYFNYRKEK